jgi:DNA helicase-2/ATP-dependent DNA helicase PcrA
VPADLLKGLNEAQRRAVLLNDKPLLVLAGAGSGKTRVLTRKIAYLILNEKIPADRILAMTFTNKAAGEMKGRVAETLGYPAENLWIGTFHSLFARILRRHAGKLGFQSNFSIYDREDSLQVIRNLLDRYNLITKLQPREILWSVLRVKNTIAVTGNRNSVSAEDEMIVELFELYEKELLKSNAMDFDDLLIKPLDLFGKNESLAERYRERFQYLLIDEFQDTNIVQFELAKILSGKRRRICVVGDEDQSIYGWRGANIGNILSFNETFSDAVTLKLEKNYRSFTPILAAASAVVKNNVGRIGKNLEAIRGRGELPVVWECGSDKTEALKIIEIINSVKSVHGYDFGDIAVLYRTNAQSRSLEEALISNGISYEIVGGTKFYERKEIKDCIAYLRFLINENDFQALQRIAVVPKKGMGEKTLERILDFAEKNNITLLAAMEKMTAEKAFGGKAAGPIANLVGQIRCYRKENAKAALHIWVEEYFRNTGLIGYYEAEDRKRAEEGYFSGSVSSRTDNIYQFIDTIQEFALHAGNEQINIAEFLQQVQLQSEVDEWNESPQKITLMTIHQAKGLEFPVVIISGLEQGILPLSRNFTEIEDLEEERRLFYVAATRARDLLYMTYAKRRFRHGAIMPALPSQFIDEIPSELISIHKEETGFGKYSSSSRGENYGKNASVYSDEPYYDYSDSQVNERTIKIGMNVRHHTFGIGKVINVEGFGGNAKITVLFFDGNFSKKLLKKIAKLEVVD